MSKSLDQPGEGKNGSDNDHKANQIDDVVHDFLLLMGTSSNAKGSLVSGRISRSADGRTLEIVTANGQEQDVGGGKQGLPGRRTQGERLDARGRTDRLGLLSPARPAFSPGPGTGRIARAQKPLRFSGRKFQVFARQIGLLIFFICVSVIPGQAQTDNSNAIEPTALIETERTIGEDRSITTRLQAIFREIEALSGVQVRVNEGVVVLSGAVANDSAADRAVELATRLQGAVAVEDRIDRTLSVEDNLDPFLQRTENTVDAVIKAWPLYAIAALAFIGVSLTAHLIASAHVVWRFFAPNPFIGDLISQSIRFFGILAGLLLALSILDAMALFGAAAGSAGLIGLAVGFAVKDTIENYVASLMLSVRQPFRADDHVVINDMEGIVVRLTSRATILMTLDGNHLRIPNAEVFKGIILNYTRNPQRRMTFDLGVDADDDPIDATAAGLETMKSLDFLLDDPKPIAFIEEVGDSNIVITFAAWIDQTRTDFLKARSAAINAVKTVLEDQGFTLPEPIYRVRLEGSDGDFLPAAQPQQGAGRLPKRPRPPKPVVPDRIDVSQDDDVRRQVAEERARGDQEDLLSDVRPIE